METKPSINSCSRTNLAAVDKTKRSYEVYLGLLINLGALCSWIDMHYM